MCRTAQGGKNTGLTSNRPSTCTCCPVRPGSQMKVSSEVMKGAGTNFTSNCILRSYDCWDLSPKLYGEGCSVVGEKPPLSTSTPPLLLTWWWVFFALRAGSKGVYSPVVTPT